MLRHVYISNKTNFACSQCRLSVKHSLDNKATLLHCPKCRRPMHDMGIGFTPPHPKDHQQWEKVNLLINHGFHFEFVTH